MKRKIILMNVLFSMFVFGQSEKNNVEKKEVETKLTEVSEEKKIENNALKIVKKKGWIKNRNYNHIRGIEVYTKGVYIRENQIYLLMELANKTNIPYDIDYSTLGAAPLKKKDRINVNEKQFSPIYTTEPKRINAKSKVKVVYVYDKFTVSDNKTLLYVLNEIDGERTLKLEIKPKYLYNAK